MAGRASNFQILVRNRDFGALWSSELISTLGDRVHRVALAALVYEKTGSLTETGIAFVATALPDLFLGPVAGVLVDRWDRRRTMIVCDLLRIPPVLLVPFVADISLWLVYALLLWLNTLSIVFRPAKTALVPSIVRPEDLNSANSLSSISENTSDIVGYPLAGALLGLLGAWLGPEAGITAAFLFDGVTYLVSALLVMAVRTPEERPAEPTTWRVIWDDLKEGVRFVQSSPVVRANTLVMLLGPLTLGAVTPLLVGYAWDVLRGGEWAYAMLGTGISVGSVVGGLWLGTESKVRPGLLVVSGLIVMGFSVMATASVAQLWPAVVAIGLGGFGSMMVMIPSVTLVQRWTPNRLLGRVFSLRSTLIFGAIIFSNAAGGWAGETFGVTRALFACGLLLVIFASLSLVFPSVREASSPAPTEEVVLVE